MGSPDAAIAEDQAKSDESPQHPVTLDKAFYIGVYEVKFSEYGKFFDDLRAGNYRCPGKIADLEDEKWGLDDRPVINVSWDDAVCYTQWLSFLTGTAYRLPTESEWEYAARADMTGVYYWGQNDPEDFAWFEANSNQTQPVGQKKPNNFGLYDMSGNAWEWVQDCWHEDYKNAPNDGSAWEQQDVGDCSRRVLRGGSWLSGTRGLRSATRFRFNPGARSYTIGFRLAKG